MAEALNLISKKIGTLTIIKKTDKRYFGSVLWKAKCDCGGERLISSHQYKNKKVTSCGCKTKGYRKTRAYYVWANMLQRCNNPNKKEYIHYGGRGIQVCKEWEESVNFIDWALENGYRDELTIERIDVNGNYEPSNCTWVSRSVQSNNKRNTKKTLINKELLSFRDIATKYEISYSTVRDRYNSGKRNLDLIYKKRKDD